MKKYLKIISLLFVIATLLSLWKLPSATLVFGIITIGVSFAFTLHNIFEKHKESENSRIKILRDILILITTFLLISFLGGVAGLFANFYISNLFGAMAGIVCAMLAGVAVGYLVRKGVAKLGA